MRDFKPVEFPTFDMQDDLPQLGQNAEAPVVKVEAAGGLNASLHSFGARLVVSREMVINDDLGMFAAASLRFASSAARLEAKHVYAVLEGNPNMADDAPMFHADFGNLLTGTPFSQSALGQATAKLRRQKGASGDETNNAPAFVVVPPEQEIAALEAVASLSNGNPPMGVIAAPWISEGNWYVMAHPERSPVVGLLRLRGAERALTVMKERAHFETNGGTVAVVADVAAAPLSRVGAVKCAA